MIAMGRDLWRLPWGVLPWGWKWNWLIRQFWFYRSKLIATPRSINLLGMKCTIQNHRFSNLSKLNSQQKKSRDYENKIFWKITNNKHKCYWKILKVIVKLSKRDTDSSKERRTTAISLLTRWRVVSAKTIGRKITSVGSCIAKSTTFFFLFSIFKNSEWSQEVFSSNKMSLHKFSKKVLFKLIEGHSRSKIQKGVRN